MIRVLITSNNATIATKIEASYYSHMDTHGDKCVFIEVTNPLTQFEVEQLRKHCNDDEIAEFTTTMFYYDMSKWSDFKQAWENAKARVRQAVVEGWVDLSDLD